MQLLIYTDKSLTKRYYDKNEFKDIRIIKHYPGDYVEFENEGVKILRQYHFGKQN